MGIRSHCMDINIICLKDYYRQLATFKLLLKMGIKVLLCMPCDTLTFKLFSMCDILKATRAIVATLLKNLHVIMLQTCILMVLIWPFLFYSNFDQ